MGTFFVSLSGFEGIAPIARAFDEAKTAMLSPPNVNNIFDPDNFRLDNQYFDDIHSVSCSFA